MIINLTIQNIISKADFSSETSFSTSLAEISQSAEISTETKLEISKRFGCSHIHSVDGMDYQLQQVKSHTEAIEKEISVKSRKKSDLDSEISELEDELNTLPLGDPKRQGLEGIIEQKKQTLEQTENDIDRLEKGKPKETSFVLREGFSVKLNPDGSRSIRIDNENFVIKLPSNNLPLFSGTKNLRTINLAFPYLALRNQNIADSLFRPNLVNDTVPSRKYRKMEHLILSSLGIDDTKILNEENIKQLNKDLSKLTLGIGTGQENLIELGIYDVASQSIDKKKPVEMLTFIRENRGLRDEMIYNKMMEIHNTPSSAKLK